MTKTAKTSIEINPLLAQRWSPRAFSNQDVSNHSLLKMLEAARWAPSANNLQPWHFIMGKKQDETYQKIFESLVEFNQLWAINAAVLILSCGNKLGKDDNPNLASKYDVGQAVAHLTIQAMSEGIYVHQMGGFSKGKIIEFFQLPDNIEPLSIVAIGYFGNPKMLPPRMQNSETAERERKSLSDFVFQNKFGEVSQLIKNNQ